jgi:tRNA(Ile)-lysidine synthase
LVDGASELLCAQMLRGDALRIEPLRQLPGLQRRELLRYWLHRLGLKVPSTRRLLGFEREFLEAGDGAQPHARWEGAELWRYDGCLHAFAELPAPAPAPDAPLPAPGGRLSLGQLGELTLELRDGAAGETLAAGTSGLSIGLRRAGERLQRWPGAPARPVKDWLREARVPPWVRERALFVRAGEVLVAIVLPGQTWVAAAHRAAAGSAGLALEWSTSCVAMKWCTFIEQEARFR